MLYRSKHSLSAWRQSIPPPAFQKGVSFLSPLLAASDWEVFAVVADLWPAHDVLMQPKNLAVSPSVCGEIKTCSFSLRWLIYAARCLAAHGFLLPRWVMSLFLYTRPENTDFVSCGQLDPPDRGHRGLLGFRSRLSAASLKSSLFNARYGSMPSAPAISTLVIGLRGSQGRCLFNRFLFESRGLLACFVLCGCLRSEMPNHVYVTHVVSASWIFALSPWIPDKAVAWHLLFQHEIGAAKR